MFPLCLTTGAGPQARPVPLRTGVGPGQAFGLSTAPADAGGVRVRPGAGPRAARSAPAERGGAAVAFSAPAQGSGGALAPARWPPPQPPPPGAAHAPPPPPARARPPHPRRPAPRLFGLGSAPASCNNSSGGGGGGGREARAVRPAGRRGRAAAPLLRPGRRGLCLRMVDAGGRPAAEGWRRMEAPPDGADLVPLDRYDAARAKIAANLQWICAKAYGLGARRAGGAGGGRLARGAPAARWPRSRAVDRAERLRRGSPQRDALDAQATRSPPVLVVADLGPLTPRPAAGPCTDCVDLSDPSGNSGRGAG